MTRDSQEILVILKPYNIIQVISLILEALWGGFILISLLPLLSSSPEAISFLFLHLGAVLFFSIFLGVILNTINTSIVVRSEGILMRGILWKTYITWDNVERIQLIYNYKTKGRSVEINAPLRSFSLNFNSKISFDTNFHRNVRKGVHYVIELAQQHNIPVKTTGLSSPSYHAWKQWAKS
jgi:hypothetical protein